MRCSHKISTWPCRTHQHLKILSTKETSQKSHPKANSAKKFQTNVSPEISIKVIWILKKATQRFVIKVCRVKMRAAVILRRMKLSWKTKPASKTPKKKCTPTSAMTTSRKKTKEIFSRLVAWLNSPRKQQRRRTTGSWCQAKRKWQITWKTSITKTRIICKIKKVEIDKVLR